jgi:hypothetical protein
MIKPPLFSTKLIIVFQNVNKDKSSRELKILGFWWEKYWNYLIYFMPGVTENKIISMAFLGKGTWSASLERIPPNPFQEQTHRLREETASRWEPRICSLDLPGIKKPMDKGDPNSSAEQD